MDCRFPPLRQWLWAILWGTLFTALFFVVLLGSGNCFSLYRILYRITIGAAVWIWFYLFFLLSHRTRVILATASLLFLFLVKPVNFLPASLAERGALDELRSLQATVETHRKNNPQQGYPLALPKMPAQETGALYKIEYQAHSSQPEGPADRFLLQLTPRQCDCGLVRSFAAAEDGKIHVSISQSVPFPASKADPVFH